MLFPQCEVCGDLLCVTILIILWPCNSYQLKGPALSHRSANSPSPGLSNLIPEKQHPAFPYHPYLILLPVCQPLHPQRLTETPSANCPHLAESSQQTAACLSEGPRAVCVSARATLRIVPYCICCAQLAVHQEPDGKHTRKKIRCAGK